MISKEDENQVPNNRHLRCSCELFKLQVIHHKLKQVAEISKAAHAHRFINHHLLLKHLSYVCVGPQWDSGRILTMCWISSLRLWFAETTWTCCTGSWPESPPFFGCEAFHVSSLAGGEVHSSFECHHKRRCLDMQDCRKDRLENLVQERIPHLQNPTQDSRHTAGHWIQWNGFRIGCRK